MGLFLKPLFIIFRMNDNNLRDLVWGLRKSLPFLNIFVVIVYWCCLQSTKAITMILRTDKRILNDEMWVCHSEYHMFYNRDTIGNSIRISQLFLENSLSLRDFRDVNFDNIIVVHVWQPPFWNRFHGDCFNILLNS